MKQKGQSTCGRRRRGRGNLSVRLEELEEAPDVFRDGWTVLGGLEYWVVNRFFGMEKVARAMLFLVTSEKLRIKTCPHDTQQVWCLKVKV